jgi:hypothetical protein
MRMVRFMPAYGIGGIINNELRKSMKSWFKWYYYSYFKIFNKSITLLPKVGQFPEIWDCNKIAGLSRLS